MQTDSSCKRCKIKCNKEIFKQEKERCLFSSPCNVIVSISSIKVKKKEKKASVHQSTYNI